MLPIPGGALAGAVKRWAPTILLVGGAVASTFALFVEGPLIAVLSPFLFVLVLVLPSTVEPVDKEDSAPTMSIKNEE